MLSEMQYLPRNSDLPKKCYFETVTGWLKKVSNVLLPLVSIRIIWQPLPFLGGTQVKPGVLLSAITPLWKHVLVKARTSAPYPRVGRETSFKLEMLCATRCSQWLQVCWPLQPHTHLELSALTLHQLLLQCGCKHTEPHLVLLLKHRPEPLKDGTYPITNCTIRKRLFWACLYVVGCWFIMFIIYKYLYLYGFLGLYGIDPTMRKSKRPSRGHLTCLLTFPISLLSPSGSFSICLPATSGCMRHCSFLRVCGQCTLHGFIVIIIMFWGRIY